MVNVLIFGASGHQGLTTCKSLLHSENPLLKKVRAFSPTHDPELEKLKRGHNGHLMEICVGDIADPNAVRNAFSNIQRVVLIQNPIHYGTTLKEGCEKELEYGRSIINLAATTGSVTDFVLSSWVACGTAKNVLPLKVKYDLEETLQTKKSKFNNISIIRLGFFFDNLLNDTLIVEKLANGKLSLPLHQSTRLPGVAIDDIGSAICQCVLDPSKLKFHNNIVELVSEFVTPEYMASTLQVPFEESSLAEYPDKCQAQIWAFWQLEGVHPDMSFVMESFPSLMNFEQFASKKSLVSKSQERVIQEVEKGTGIV
ncbi:hypothetical protein P9112_014627 [Eukaryota sp. TZLM1-RC]